MVVAKIPYHSPRLRTFGNTREVLLSDASPQVRQAVLELADKSRKILRCRDAEQA